mmetsp:Transcript_6670/g.9604  ORF Transcript_6670/g.9604 Transcript_6670/m.9604 type:complete len:403 (+) Transcript_6670:60-1268(+)
MSSWGGAKIWISKAKRKEIRARRRKLEYSGKKKNGEKDLKEGKGYENGGLFSTSSSLATSEGAIDNNNVTNVSQERVITIRVPSELTGAKARKFRKMERRKIRKHASNDELSTDVAIIFVDENGKEIATGDDNNESNSDEKKNSKELDNNESEQTQTMTKANKKKKLKVQSYPNINEAVAAAKLAAKISQEETERRAKEENLPEDSKQKYVAIDCEMVGVGEEGKRSALARVSVVNWYNDVLLDTFVKVPDRVTDFRTHVSGVTPSDIKSTSNAMELVECRKTVGELLRDKVVVGHALKNDFDALLLDHPKSLIRDTARYKPFMRSAGRNGGKLRPRKLKDLVKENTSKSIQIEGQAHSSIEDAQGAMELFKVVREKWEKDLEKKKKEMERHSTHAKKRKRN